MKNKMGGEFSLGVLLSIICLALVGCGGGGGSDGGTTTAAPGAFSLTSPANLATNVSTQPNLVWAAASGATSYSVQLKKSTDASYAQVAAVSTTNYTAVTALTASTEYDWQVIASNTYGTSTAGPSQFTTTSSSVEVVDCSTVISATTVTATPSNTFSPSNVTIAVNGEVRWISASAVPHTVTSGIVTGGTVTTVTPDGKFDQPLNTNGSSVCLKFTVAGTYNYYCQHHYAEGMKGVVTVQ